MFAIIIHLSSIVILMGGQKHVVTSFDFDDYDFPAHAKAVISIGDHMQAFILITIIYKERMMGHLL